MPPPQTLVAIRGRRRALSIVDPMRLSYWNDKDPFLAVEISRAV
jgi:hypothetical protein